MKVFIKTAYILYNNKKSFMGKLTGFLCIYKKNIYNIHKHTRKHLLKSCICVLSVLRIN